MFRKPKRAVKATLRTNPDEGDGQDDTYKLLEEARGLSKKSRMEATTDQQQKRDHHESKSNVIMHQYKANSAAPVSAAELATRIAEYHPENKNTIDETGKGEDGIFRNQKRNAFLAGPLKASTFVRTTCRFDYQPDICKDYKDTGFCGFGDTCIYLHDRGDTLTGWQLEQQWEEQRKKDLQKRELDIFAGTTTKDVERPQELADDGLPFACYLCRESFTDPVVTSCGHYFCERCILDHVQNKEKSTCPICGKDTHGVFNQPTKLLSKKRRILGNTATWEEFADASRKPTADETGAG